MKIIFRNMQGYDDLTNGVCNEIISIRFDINDHVENSFCYVGLKLKYDLILGKPWMKKNGVQYHPEPKRLWIRSFKIEVENVFGKKLMKLDCMQISSTGFYMQSKKVKKDGKKVKVFSSSMADIDKALNVKPKIKFKTIILEQYWGYLNVFDENETNQLPPIRRKKINHEIELLEEERKKPTVPWGPLYNMSKDELLVLRKTLTEYLDKSFIRINNSPAAAPVFFVKKPGGGLRFCVDYRSLNRITKK